MQDVLNQAAEYERTYSIVGRAHYVASDRFTIRNRWLGIPVVIITAVVGTTIFGTLNENPDPKLRIVAGLLSLCGAVLAALQTTFGYAQTAERHKAAAARYRAIRRQLKTFRLKYSDAPPDERSEAIEELESLNKELEAIAAESPNIPDACYDRAVKDYELEQSRLKQPGT
jgi:hypothetical protein